MKLRFQSSIKNRQSTITGDTCFMDELMKWKSSSRRKPLLLQGARQTGKTFILKEFGCNEYCCGVFRKRKSSSRTSQGCKGGISLFSV
jgi:hypothetical protein